MDYTAKTSTGETAANTTVIIYCAIALALQLAFVLMIPLKVEVFIAGVLASSILLVSAVSWQKTPAAIIALVFVNSGAIGFWFSELASFGYFFLVSIIVSPNYGAIIKKNRLVAVLMALFLSGLISGIVASHYLLFLWSYLRFSIPILLILALTSSFANPKSIKLGITLFSIGAILNSVHIMAVAPNVSHRFFGFTGVWFVDYATMGIICSIFFVFNTKGAQRIFWALSGLIQFVGLLTTQTRNPLLSLALTGVIFFVILYIMRKRLRIPKLAFVRSLFLVLLIASGSFLVAGQKFLDRLNSSKTVETMVVESDLSSNTLITRILIWDTAINALKAHPLLGIGLYQFERISGQYYTFSDTLFEMYVEGLSPHLGYLSILTGMGIIGFILFLFVLYLALRMAISNLKIPDKNDPYKYRYLSFSLFLYFLFSFALTDFWLYGHGLILMGFIFGLIVIIHQKMNPENSNNGV